MGSLQMLFMNDAAGLSCHQVTAENELNNDTLYHDFAPDGRRAQYVGAA